MSLRQTEDTPDELTPEYCSCGTRLAENARFCHMCGKPTFELAVASEEVVLPPPLAAAPASAGPVQLPVSFSNPIALRVAFLMSLGIMLTTMIPIVNVFSPVWWLAAGLGAVLLYRRQTGLSLSVQAGARLGSITGVLAFLSLLVIIALTFAVSGTEAFQQMVKQNPQASEVLNNTPALVLGTALTLAVLFAMVVGICAAGGALGARFANRNAKI